MQKEFENPATPSIEKNNQNENPGTKEKIEAGNLTIEDTKKERIEALEEGVRLSEINRDAALIDLERWQDTNTTEPSHFEYRLPEIQNRINQAEHRITSSKLDIDIIKADPKSPDKKDEIIKSFIAGQVLDGKTASLRDRLLSFDKQEASFNERLERNHRATEKLQSELDEINAMIEADDSDRLKLNRRDVVIEMNGVSDRYEVLTQEKIKIEALAKEREMIQSQIDAIMAGGVTDEELPNSIKEDPDFAACLREADTYNSDDDRLFKRNVNYNPEETAIKLFSDRFPQKSAYYERLVTNAPDIKNEQNDPSPEDPTSTETPADKITQTPRESFEGIITESLTNDQQQLNQEKVEAIINNTEEISKSSVVNYIQTEKATGTLNTEPDYEKLKAEPIIDTRSFYDIEPSRADKGSFELVATEKIIGRPNADNYEDGWAHEYNERKGRIGEIVDQINNPENEAGVERIFHTEDKLGDRIKLASYEGPAGPIYSVFDGTHRVAGVKASGLEKMPAEIFRTEYPYKKITANKEETADWQDKIDRGFIIGTIETFETENGEQSMLIVESEVVPWIRARNQNDIFKLNQVYEQQYPGALEQVGFPKETLTDRTAFWAYMDGNFSQWKQLQKQPNQPETQTTEDEVEEVKVPKSITTAKGSVYTYLKDGRTQRFKSAEGEMEEPQNVLVFIPRVDNIADWEHFDRLPDWIKENDNDQVMEILASDYIQNPNKRVVLTDESNEIVRSNADATKAKSLILQFVENATNQTEFALPVSSKPEIGATTYDARYFDKDGKEHVLAHIGNVVTSIDY
ncbi:hypothetical protein KC845_00110 [Candidatus Kaiserbacteria bacterium]|nr:hypothetical protein [Candidatus Kaiserbacteria bacterium]